MSDNECELKHFTILKDTGSLIFVENFGEFYTEIAPQDIIKQSSNSKLLNYP